eukprot:COSAG02_NODE_49426_length_327_cov_0.491228_1_plen_82_part_01
MRAANLKVLITRIRSVRSRLCDATRSGMVTSDRGFRESNCDDIVLRLDNGDKVNYMYCVTPQPIQRTNWGLYVSECKLVVLK